MQKEIKLDQNWSMRWEDLAVGKDQAGSIQKKKDGWFSVSLPCSVHEVLANEGIIPEPLVGFQSKESEWIEKKSWWFTRSFSLDEETLKQENIRLMMNGLDWGADIWLNGNYLGQHKNYHRPWIDNVKEYLSVGENDILLRLTCGYESISDQEVAALDGDVIFCGGRGDDRRAFLRKPQFVAGWDWAPRAVTCGIGGPILLLAESDVIVRDFYVSTKEYQPDAKLDVSIELENMDTVATRDCEVTVTVTQNQSVVSQQHTELVARAGKNYVNMEVCVKDPDLWWPNGYGKQSRYQIEVRVETAAGSHSRKILYGIRKIVLNQASLNGSEKQFSVNVNGVDIFCKGGNWVPADSIFTRISEEKYRTLLTEAQELHFDMLRIWGGGIFEPDLFYDLCDELGILLWHDFMYACSIYPEYNKEFLQENYAEIDYQIRRLRNHPCMAVWCGNNEMHWIFNEEGEFKVNPEFMKKTCHKIFNHIIPELLNKNAPDAVYWNSSPYGGPEASSELMGDNHIWTNQKHPVVEFAAHETYDCRKTKFMSEYGYTGPCKQKSVEEYCGKHITSVNDPVYAYHSHFPDKDYEKSEWYEGLRLHYGNVDISNMDSYLLYGGLTQGEVLQYSLEAYQSKTDCSGALIWMYDDAWGEDGWTPIDYYMRRKVSFYFVKRALTPVKLILKNNSGQLTLTLINNTPENKTIPAEYGYQLFDGSDKQTVTKTFEIKARSRQQVCLGKITEDTKKGIYYIRPLEDPSIPTAYLRARYVREMDLEQPHINCQMVEHTNTETIFEVRTDKFAHAIHFDLDADIKLSDDYFDLLPEEVKRVKIQINAQHLPGAVHPVAVIPNKDSHSLEEIIK